MSGVAGIVHWDGRPASERALQKMLALIEHRGSDGLTSTTTRSVAFGAARLGLDRNELPARQPACTPDRSRFAVADARLYNRRELQTILSGSAWLGTAPTNEELILAAYDRWGTGLCDHLSGDFAFVVWDDRKKHLFAARDPFGVKPLFYRSLPSSFAFGSEVKQLLVGHREPIRPNVAAVAEHLLAAPNAGPATCIEGIHRLEPGRLLLVTVSGVEQDTHWPRPEHLAPDPDTAKEYSAQFLHLLQQAVARRLRSDVSVALELSGGHDSSAIAVLAGALCESGRVSPPGVLLLSHVYPGLACDEQDFIRTVTDSLPFARRSIDCSSLGPAGTLSSQHWDEGAPDSDLALMRTELVGEALSEAGTRVLLTGLGGDELTWEPEWAPDHMRTGDLAAAVRHVRGLSRVGSDSTLATVLGQAARLTLGPQTRRHLRRLVGTPRLQVPPWIDRDLRAVISKTNRLGGNAQGLAFTSRAQEQIFSWLTSPVVRWGLERAELRMAYQGVELRHPFFDRELVEFVLSIPWQARIEEPGRVKPLLIRSLGTRLPDKVRYRRGRAIFNDFFEGLMGEWVPVLRESILTSDSWASAGYTTRAEVLIHLDSWRRGAGQPWRSTLQLWAAVNLELWLRNIGGWAETEADTRTRLND